MSDDAKRKAGETFLVKVQLPLATNADPRVLIYDETRSLEAMLPLTRDIKRLFGDGRGNPYKRYFLGAHPG